MEKAEFYFENVGTNGISICVYVCFFFIFRSFSFFGHL